MKVRLLARDSKYPNLAIMKISTYHKQKGDDVNWYDPLFDYQDTDILYESQIFNFTEKYEYYPPNAKIYRGGTGIDIKSKLPEEIESIKNLDYSLYPECDFSIMFTTRGCIRQCPFCVVNQKEGLIHDIDIVSLNPNGKYIKVCDNNFFASSTWKERLDKLKAFNQPLDFNSGIDLRILNEEQAQALKSCKIKVIHCAWDNYEDKEKILPKIKLLTQYVPARKVTCYVLIGFKHKQLHEEDIERVNTLWSMGVYPFVMPYIDYNDPNYKKDKSCNDFARWCNNRFVFKSCTWEEYKKGIDNGTKESQC